MKASDISDERIMQAVKETQGICGVPHWSSLYQINENLKEFPEKVILAKLKSMVKKKKLKGCTCGCRGDFEILEDKWL